MKELTFIFNLLTFYNKRAGLFCLALFCLLFNGSLLAQNDSTDITTPLQIKDIHWEPNDKASAATPQIQYKEAVVTESNHSAKKALLLSTVLPGAGQVYNHQAWKVPIIYAVFGGIGYFTYDNFKKMKDYRDEYLYRVNHDGTPQDPEMATTPTNNIYNLYQNYSKSFQLSVIIAAAVYGLNLIDAYVFGHLFDFQINDDLSMDMTPMLMPMPSSQNITGLSFSPSFSISLRF